MKLKLTRPGQTTKNNLSFQISTFFESFHTWVTFQDKLFKEKHLFYLQYSSDPGVPWVRSMGPNDMSLMLLPCWNLTDVTLADQETTQYKLITLIHMGPEGKLIAGKNVLRFSGMLTKKSSTGSLKSWPDLVQNNPFWYSGPLMTISGAKRPDFGLFGASKWKTQKKCEN